MYMDILKHGGMFLQVCPLFRRKWRIRLLILKTPTRVEILETEKTDF